MVLTEIFILLLATSEVPEVWRITNVHLFKERSRDKTGN